MGHRSTSSKALTFLPVFRTPPLCTFWMAPGQSIASPLYPPVFPFASELVAPSLLKSPSCMRYSPSSVSPLPTGRHPTVVALRRGFMLSRGNSRSTRTFLEERAIIEINVGGVMMGAFKKSRCCIICIICWTFLLGEKHVRHFALSPFRSLPFLSENLELPHPCHFLGILKSNSIIFETGCEMDWFADADHSFATHLLPQPQLPEDRRDGAFVTKTKGIMRSYPLMILGSGVGFTGLEQRFTLPLTFTLIFLVIHAFFRFKQIRGFMGLKSSTNSVKPVQISVIT